MRVIAGSAKRLQLKTPDGPDTRPPTDRIKETLFNMIQGELYDCLFLDLFSGSGAIGIEALSRGARRCYFVEQAKEAVACIRQNLDATHLGQKAVVMDCDVLAAIGRLKGKEKPFDFIFMDAAKAQYIYYLPDVLRVLKPGGVIVSDNILQEGEVLESHFLVEKRNRTIHDRMREYLYVLTHDDRLETAILPVGDGMAISVVRELCKESVL